MNETGLGRVIAIFLTVIITGLSFWNYTSIDVFAGAKDKSLSSFDNQSLITHEYRYLFHVEGSGDVTVMVTSSVELTQEPDDSYYKYYNRTGLSGNYSRELYYDYADSYGSSKNNDPILDGQAVSGFGQIEYLISKARYVNDQEVDWDTGQPPVDYGTPTATVATEFAALRFEVTGHGPDIDTVGLNIYELQSTYTNGTGLEILNGDYDLALAAQYTSPFDLSLDPTTFRWGQGDGWSHSKIYRFELPYYDDGQLIGTMIIMPDANQLEFDHKDVVAVSDLINSGWRISYGKDSFTVSNVSDSYNDLKFQLSDLTDNSLPISEYQLEVLERGTEYEIPYPNALTWHHEYLLVISKKTSIITYSELASFEFIYGYTPDNTGSSSNMDTGSLEGIYEGMSMEDVTGIMSDMTDDAQEGLAALGILFAMMPWPFNNVLVWIVGLVILVITVGVILVLLGR